MEPIYWILISQEQFTREFSDHFPSPLRLRFIIQVKWICIIKFNNFCYPRRIIKNCILFCYLLPAINWLGWKYRVILMLIIVTRRYIEPLRFAVWIFIRQMFISSFVFIIIMKFSPITIPRPTLNLHRYIVILREESFAYLMTKMQCRFL